MKSLKRWAVLCAFAAVAVAQTPAITSYALPQLAFGGGWYTAIYFNNRTNGALPANVFFFDENGQPLPTPSLASSIFGSGLAAQLATADTVTVSTSTTVNVPPLGTAIVEVPNSGSLQQGWARVDVPAGMVGYGVFRYTLSVPGQPTQLSEGLIPFASTSSTFSSLIFDDTAYVTAVAFANPSSVAASINIRALDAAGQVINTVPQTLGPGARTAIVLRSVPGLESVAGQRGAVEFSATTGAVSVLGLRFNNLTFTSIPPFDK